MEALEVKYHSDQQKFLITGETFTDWLDMTDAKAGVGTFTVAVGSQKKETKPITI